MPVSFKCKCCGKGFDGHESLSEMCAKVQMAKEVLDAIVKGCAQPQQIDKKSLVNFVNDALMTLEKPLVPVEE